jgi:hypothetical protein
MKQISIDGTVLTQDQATLLVRGLVKHAAFLRDEAAKYDRFLKSATGGDDLRYEARQVDDLLKQMGAA